MVWSEQALWDLQRFVVGYIKHTQFALISSKHLPQQVYQSPNLEQTVTGHAMPSGSPDAQSMCSTSEQVLLLTICNFGIPLIKEPRNEIQV